MCCRASMGIRISTSSHRLNYHLLNGFIRPYRNVSSPKRLSSKNTNFVFIGMQVLSLKGLFTNFEYITFFSYHKERNIFYERFISIKQLWLEIIEKIWCSQTVRPSTVIYVIYITRTEFEHHFSQLFLVRVVLSRWSFHKNVSFVEKHLWTIPLGEWKL